ncbi:phytoene/squalene synthase family protein [Cumulibacter manganitolerans]|uniref:phytoene/squalene synthase family protein n=1 Tax=Cumulibacter manganitolerans TaxID=1884992 RepID=UPI001297FF79|nr:phytoene/squalene synthase family protein [Cumulibacter manganitolerans]
MSRSALDASYDRCHALLREHGRTYHLASRLLPREIRPAVWALYGFARYVDDLVDVELERAPDVAVVDEIERLLLDGLRRGRSDHPVLAATVDTVRRYAIEPRWLIDFLASMRRDLTPQHYPTWEALREYTWGSAAVIGLQMAQVIGVVGDAARARTAAAALGDAFQITNFTRDFDEDRRRGRIYLPGELFTAAGVDPATTDRAALAPVIRAACAHARGLYREAEPGIALLQARGRPCIRAAFTLYQGILDEIEASGYDVLGVRHRVSTRRRLRLAAPLLAGSVVARVRPGPAPHRQH